MQSLFKSRKNISNSLRTIFDDIYIQFASPWSNPAWEIEKSLTQSIEKFEINLKTIDISDRNFLIERFQGYVKTFKEHSNIYDAVNNDRLRTATNHLSIDDQETFMENREIAISLMEDFIVRLSEDVKIFNSNVIFKGDPTEFIELVVALEYSGSIQTTTGKKLKRKDLLITLEKALNYSYHGEYSTLLNAKTNYKISKTPFIDTLKKSFESYCNLKLQARK